MLNIRNKLTPKIDVENYGFVYGMTTVGLPGMAVQESCERIQIAFKNAGLHFPRHRIVVNLAPASVRKEGPAYDLPIALRVIILSGHLLLESVQDTLVVGELSLDGIVRHTRGILPMAAAEAALIPDLEIIPVKILTHLYDHLTGHCSIEPFNHPMMDSRPSSPPRTLPGSRDRSMSNARWK